MGKLKGITVVLFERTQTGKDELNRPVYNEIPVDVENVLVGEPTSEDVINELNLTGHRLAYTLGIPKGDAHDWTGCRVDFYGESFKVYARPTQGIEAMIPLDWNKKVKVEAYE